MLISSIYVAPTAKIDMNIFQELYNINNNCTIVGDLNETLSEMGSIKTNARGKQLQELLNEGLIEFVDDDSTTFEKNDYGTKLDWILGSHPLLSFITNVETHPTIGTKDGHKPLTFDIRIGAEPKPTSPRLSLNFKNLNPALNIEEHAMFITNSKMLVTNEAVPTSTPTRKSYALTAFDSVWHEGLIYKLNDLRLPKYIINYLTSFLKNRTASIEIENVLSRQFNLKSGTPQRSPLSPLLYIIYTADSMNDIPTHTEYGLFADDTALWTSSNTMTYLSSRLQQSVDAFEVGASHGN
ncbi:unnamed protein product [Rotaria magnacalcarata]